MSDKWRNKRMASDYDEEPAQQFESYRDDSPDVLAEPATRVIIENGRVVFASHGGSDESYELSLIPELCGPEFSRATPEAPEHYDIISQRAELTPSEKYKEEFGSPDADSFFRACAHKRPSGAGSSSSNGKSRERPQKKSTQEQPATEKPTSKCGGPGMMAVDGLTLGEQAIYQSFYEFDLAEAVLENLAAAVKAGYVVPQLTARVTQIGKPVKNFFVKVSPENRIVLRAFPGSARAALVDFAHARNADRIARIDAGWRADPEQIREAA